jgi:hypothetical protein
VHHSVAIGAPEPLRAAVFAFFRVVVLAGHGISPFFPSSCLGRARS